MKNYVLFFENINIIATSFEIRNSIGKLHKDFRTLFVFKHRRKTKKFTLKWQIPLIEKQVQGMRGLDGGGSNVWNLYASWNNAYLWMSFHNLCTCTSVAHVFAVYVSWDLISLLRCSCTNQMQFSIPGV